MGIRRLVDTKHEVLKLKAASVKSVKPPILKLINDMVETMHFHNGLGLAAPQIGISKEIIVVNKGDGEVLKLINPVLLESCGSIVDVEGCLSVPGVYGEVCRAAEVVVEAIDENNNCIKIEADGLFARILQHEIDHLKGTLFIDKAERLIDPEEMETQEAKS